MADWEKIKTEYVTTDISIRKLAEKYGVNPNTVGTHLKREGWTKQKNAIKRKVNTVVTQKIVKAQAEAKIDRLQTFNKTIDKLMEAAYRSVEDLDKRIVAGEVVGGQPIQPKDIKSLTSSLQDIANMLGYMPNNFADEEDDSTGVVVLPPVMGRGENE